MSAAIIIPARFGSTRFPGKPLTRLSLKDGSSKSLIELSWEAASKVKEVDRVYIATDHLDIKNAAEKFGAQVIMTSVDCENGTSRCAEAVKLAGIQEDLIVNFQGDAPLTPHHFVSSLVNEMKADNAIKVATPILQCSHEHYQQLLNDRQNNRVGATTVVFDKNSDALYFSKEVFDGTYPGYGSSYPDLQGGLGLLFEQASSRGLKQKTAYGEITFPFTSAIEIIVLLKVDCT